MLHERMLLPLHVNVTHFFSCDALFIQKDILGVPDDHPQDIPKRDVWGKRFGLLCQGCQRVCTVWGYSLLGFAGSDVEWRAWWS